MRSENLMPGTSVTDNFSEELDSMVSGGCPDDYDEYDNHLNDEDKDREEGSQRQDEDLN